MLLRSAKTSTLRDRELGIEHQRDTEDDCHHYKAINHHLDSGCRLSDTVNFLLCSAVSTSSGAALAPPSDCVEGPSPDQQD
jgi:hypothetical protein